MGRPAIYKRVITPGERWRRRMRLRQEKRKLMRGTKQAGQLKQLKRRQDAESQVSNAQLVTPLADNPAQERDGQGRLIAAYQARGSNFPKWAYRRPDGTTLPPSVPFIGRQYPRWGGVLVYASAENLAFYGRRQVSIPPYLTDCRAWNRHRIARDTDRGDGFFPGVHMAPFDDGSLLVAVHYYLTRVHGEELNDPVDLLESIAAANFCKFSAAGEVNKDYAANAQMIASSIAYFRDDLQHLRPRLIFIPKTMWRHRKLRLPEIIEDLAPGALVCPLYQFNPGVVQRNLKHLAERAERLREQLAGTRLEAWIAQMRRYKRLSPYRYLIHMDEELGWPPYERRPPFEQDPPPRGEG